jgi:acyl-CoA reductase-like NAD-dependent aldehyde dehydrogenase
MSTNLKIAQGTPTFQLLINGRLTPGAISLDVINPATAKRLATCARADEKQLNAAVGAAKAAFPGWSTTTIEKRRAVLMNVAEALAARREEFASTFQSLCSALPPGRCG